MLFTLFYFVHQCSQTHVFMQPHVYINVNLLEVYIDRNNNHLFILQWSHLVYSTTIWITVLKMNWNNIFGIYN